MNPLTTTKQLVRRAKRMLATLSRRWRLVAQGDALVREGNLPAAVRRYQDALREYPWDTRAWRGIARIADATGQFQGLFDFLSESAFDYGLAQAPAGGEDDASRYAWRRGLPIADRLLREMLPDAKFVVLDGGAREAEADARWSRLDPQRLEIHGFEPDEPECARLNLLAQKGAPARHYYPAGLWSIDGTLPFHENHAGGGSSFMEQNQSVTDRWKFENPTQVSLSRDIFRPKRTYEMKVVKLETWARDNGISAIDFIKLNVQGGELEILRTAGPVLDTTLGLLIEVSFCESYKGRPLFSNIDIFVREKGFVFFDLLAHHYIGREASPLAQQHLKSVRPKLGQLVSAWGQLVEGHALYLRDPIAANPNGPSDKLAIRNALMLACIAEIYGQMEYAIELLDWIGRSAEAPRAASIIDRAVQDYRSFY